MKTWFKTPFARFDARSLQATMDRALAQAGLHTPSGQRSAAGDAVRRLWVGESWVQGGTALKDFLRSSDPPIQPVGERLARMPRHRFNNPAGARDYLLYTPANLPTGPRPVVVMLHGCTQSAEDFAAGTRMNQLAEQAGVLVLYPEQNAQANVSRCWNWFKPQDQMRDHGEPSLIVGMVQVVVHAHGGDARRVFVAGLSAGAAMAVVLGETYPDVFAAVGAHSGLPHGSAHDVPSAMAAMKGGRRGLPGMVRPRAQPVDAAHPAVPTIVFHGDRDSTVQQSNGQAIVAWAQQAHGGDLANSTLLASHTPGEAGGRRFTRSVYQDAVGHHQIESWVLHGAGHAWSGGDVSGSYTDPKGPDASAEMLRFFLSRPVAAAG